MPVLSYIHQLFNTDQCQAYIHTLRWKDRPLHCPRCQSHDIGPWGTYHYRPGLKRSLNLSHFVARQIWRRRGMFPLRCRAHRLQRRGPL